MFRVSFNGEHENHEHACHPNREVLAARTC